MFKKWFDRANKIQTQKSYSEILKFLDTIDDPAISKAEAESHIKEWILICNADAGKETNLVPEDGSGGASDYFTARLFLEGEILI